MYILNLEPILRFSFLISPIKTLKLSQIEKENKYFIPGTEYFVANMLVTGWSPSASALTVFQRHPRLIVTNQAGELDKLG